MPLIYDTGTLYQRGLTKLVRNPTLLVTNLATPLVFFLLFAQLFQKLDQFPGVSGNYVTYLTPGIVLLVALMNAPQSGVAIVNDLNSGFLSKMLLTQVSRPAILLGRLLTDVTVVVAQAILVLGVAVLLGVTIVTGVPGVLLILLMAAFFEVALSGVFLVVGMRSRKNETISALSGALFFPLIFVSSAMFPASFFPAWAQTVSSYNPVSYAADVVRELVQGGLTWGTAVPAFAATGLIGLLAIGAMLYQFRKVVG